MTGNSRLLKLMGIGCYPNEMKEQISEFSRVVIPLLSNKYNTNIKHMKCTISIFVDNNTDPEVVIHKEIELIGDYRIKLKERMELIDGDILYDNEWRIVNTNDSYRPLRSLFYSYYKTFYNDTVPIKCTTIRSDAHYLFNYDIHISATKSFINKLVNK